LINLQIFKLLFFTTKIKIKYLLCVISCRIILQKRQKIHIMQSKNKNKNNCKNQNQYRINTH